MKRYLIIACCCSMLNAKKEPEVEKPTIETRARESDTFAGRLFYSTGELVEAPFKGIKQDVDEGTPLKNLVGNTAVASGDVVSFPVQKKHKSSEPKKGGRSKHSSSKKKASRQKIDN